MLTKAPGTKELTINLDLDIDIQPLDDAIKKADKLVELLQEAQQIVDSLSGAKTGAARKTNNDTQILREWLEKQERLHKTTPNHKQSRKE